LSDTEIDKMVKNAEANAAADKERRDAIEARNQLDGLVYKVEKDSKEWVDRLAPEMKAKLDAALETGKQALRSGEPAGITSALNELNGAYSAAGASLYQQATQSQPEGGPTDAGAAGGQQQAGGKPDDVVEADYEIVDDNKK
jgi:molecular chaperone DnaK